MKKLYENIENINIKGGVDQLSDIVRVMDVSLQNIADNSEQLVGYLSKYSSSNKGLQFEKVTLTASKLRDMLFDASYELNEMQNQIVTYQNKIYRYEDMAQAAVSPNPYLVTKRPIMVDKTAVQFSRSDMIQVVAVLRNYSEKVYHHLKQINRKKNEAALIWLDSQYKDFASFVEMVTKNVINAIRTYEEYVIYLEEKIKELG